MVARAMWRAELDCGDVALPVKLYAAAQDRSIHFRLLHAEDRQPVEQRMLRSDDGEVVPREEIRRGVEIAPHTFAMLDAETLDATKPEASRVIEVMRFVPQGAIGHALYERPYYLGPDGDAAQDYFALAAALADEGREGVVRWTMRNKSYVGALQSIDGYLALIALRYADEVVAASRLKGPGGRELSKKELQMAEQLVSMLEAEFRPGDFQSDYRVRVRELVEAKARGEKVEVHALAPKRPTEDLSAALAESIQRAGKRRRHG